MTTQVTNTETNEVKRELDRGNTFSNRDFQFVLRTDGVMLRYDLNKDTYKFFNDVDVFARAIVRFTKRGW